MKLRVMTYNIFEGAAGREEGLLAVIRHHAPDLLLLQEVVDRESAARWAAALGMALGFAESNSRTRNVALLSRLPLLRCEAYHPFPLLRTLLLSTVVLPDGQPLNLFGVHLGLLHDWWRVYELRAILPRIAAYRERHPAPYALIGGDFNSVAAGDRVALGGLERLYAAILALQFARFPRHALARVARAGYVDCFRALHPEAPGFTVPAHRPSVRLDYLFASPALHDRLHAITIPAGPGELVSVSDHLPLFADFIWG